MFDQMPEHHVATTTRQTDPREVLGRGLGREPISQSFECIEGVEHFRVSTGVGPAALDDIGSVLAVFAGRVQERASLCAGVIEGRQELTY